MDLGAFLAPGFFYPVYLDDEQEKTEPWGCCFCRPNRRGAWMAYQAPLCPSRLRLRLELPDFSLLKDGSFRSEKGSSATLILIAEVNKCRLWASKNIFVLHFENLVRFLPDKF